VARPAAPAFSAAAALGIEKSQDGGGWNPAILVEGAMPLRTTPAGVALSLVLPVRTVYLRTEDVATTKTSGLSVEVTPTLRAAFALRPGRLSLRVDGGAGVVQRWSSVETDVQFLGRHTTTHSDTAALLRVGAALELTLRNGVVLTAEPLSLGYDLDGGAVWSIAFGAAFRL
jgi:hypothetical protein